MNYIMSKLKLLTIAVIGLLIMNIAVVGFLLMRKPPHPPGERPLMTQEGGPRNIIIERLHFDGDQVEEYEKLITEHQSAIRQIDDSIRMMKNELYHTLTSDSFAGKDSLVDRLGILQKEIELTHYDHFARIKKICKPAQMEEFNKLTEELARLFAPGKKGSPPPKD